MENRRVVLIDALANRDKEAISEAIRDLMPRRTVYFLMGGLCGREFLQREGSHRNLHWNWDGRIFDEKGIEYPASDIRELEPVRGSLKCFYVADLPFDVKCDEDVKFAFCAEYAEVNYG